MNETLHMQYWRYPPSLPADNVAKYQSTDVPKVDLVIIYIGQTDLMWGAIKPVGG